MAKATAAEVKRATELGKAAFEDGRSRVAAWDKDLMAMLAGNQVGEGLPIIEAWVRAWDTANLAAPFDW